jgi:hypothetical protein
VKLKKNEKFAKHWKSAEKKIKPKGLKTLKSSLKKLEKKTTKAAAANSSPKTAAKITFAKQQTKNAIKKEKEKAKQKIALESDPAK